MHFLDAYHEVVRQFPHQPAIFDQGQETTHHQLWQEAQGICAWLRELSIPSGSHIGLAIAKSKSLVTAMLGVWMHGSVYVPLDPALPVPRLKEYADQAQVAVIIVTDFAHDFNGKARQLTVIQRGAECTVETQIDQPAYLIFSSGSTGRAKGILLSHLALVSVLRAQINALSLNETDRTLWVLSMQFDASISDIGVSLLSGACLVIDEARSTIEALHAHAITYADLPPSVLGIYSPEQLPNTLSRVLIGGEVCPPDVIDRHRQHRHVLLVYGPTEATICSSMILCTAHQSAVTQSIGRPIDGVSYRIVDTELWIAGACLAVGYWHNPVLNAQKWLIHDGLRYFRTGDIVRQVGTEYQFLGRVDRQIKIRGRLIAPEEIELQCLALGCCVRAAVLTPTDTHALRLHAFLQCDVPVATDWLKAKLSEVLPEWMIPHSVTCLTRLPETPTGKIDFQALRNLLAATSIEPSEGSENHFWCGLFEAVLGRPVGLDTSFFDAGGDSLLALSLLALAASRGRDLSLKTLKANPSPIELSYADAQSDACADVDLDLVAQKLLEGVPPKMLHRLKEKTPVLLTGGSGFLGRAVLRELNRCERPIRMLLRGQSSKKLRQNDAMYFGMNLELVYGDLTDASVIDDFTKGAEGFPLFHCAADVGLDKRLSDNSALNVQATSELLKRVGPSVNFASSLAVFLSSSQRRGVLTEEDLRVQGLSIYGGYAQSKWMAERIAAHHNAAIFRLGFLHDLAQARPNDWLSLFVRGLCELRAVPLRALDARFNWTDLTDAAKILVEMGLNPLREGVYHIAAAQFVTLRQLIELFGQLGIDIKPCSEDEFSAIFERHRLSTPARMVYLALQERELGDTHLPQFSLFLSTGAQFDTRRSDELSNHSAAPPDMIALRTWIRRICSK